MFDLYLDGVRDNEGPARPAPMVALAGGGSLAQALLALLEEIYVADPAVEFGNRAGLGLTH